ncbi:MAG: glycerol acyltransferase [Bacteroidetes bacterium]|nr:glycerol acyltransferase [Bacteroidota bacterium]
MAELQIEIPEKLINIEGLFKAKNPRLLKLIPAWFMRYLKRIIHQDEVNGYIYRNRDKFGLPFVEAILGEFGVAVNTGIPGMADAGAIEQLSRILLDRRVIVASNHPLGGLDGLALMNQIGKVRPDIVFPVNDLLMNIPGLKPLFIPVNKHGKNTENARIIDENFAGSKVILYFPAGLVSRKFKGGIIRDLDWKNTFIKKAKKYERDVLPVYISGRNSNWFYNLSKWRKKLGIKANIEMLYLADEMMKQKGHTIRIIVGDLITWQSFDKSRNDLQWADYVKQKVYDLSKHQE